MKAALLRRFSEPYELADIPIPRPGAGECLVRVRAAGVCRTDLKIAAGTFADTPLPMVPGHEVAGELATPAEDLPEGRRVAIQPFRPCGNCRWCLTGQETLCPDPPRIGFNRDGGLAEYVCVPVSTVIPFSDHLPFEVAAVGMDAVVSPWRALLVRAELRMGDMVVVVGAGGLGLSAVQIARTAGARVSAVDPIPSHREEALWNGAELAVAPEEATRLLDWSGGGADVVYEGSGTAAGLKTAALLVVPGGRLVCNGWGPDQEYGLPSQQLVLKEIALIGSRAGSGADARATLRALERGQLRPTLEKVRLHEINETMTRLREGRMVGRLVVMMGAA